jgi:hypothetical protein
MAITPEKEHPLVFVTWLGQQTLRQATKLLRNLAEGGQEDRDQGVVPWPTNKAGNPLDLADPDLSTREAVEDALVDRIERNELEDEAVAYFCDAEYNPTGGGEPGSPWT